MMLLVSGVGGGGKDNDVKNESKCFSALYSHPLKYQEFRTPKNFFVAQKGFRILSIHLGTLKKNSEVK